MGGTLYRQPRFPYIFCRIKPRDTIFLQAVRFVQCVSTLPSSRYRAPFKPSLSVSWALTCTIGAGSRSMPDTSLAHGSVRPSSGPHGRLRLLVCYNHI